MSPSIRAMNLMRSLAPWFLALATIIASISTGFEPTWPLPSRPTEKSLSLMLFKSLPARCQPPTTLTSVSLACRCGNFGIGSLLRSGIGPLMIPEKSMTLGLVMMPRDMMTTLSVAGGAGGLITISHSHIYSRPSALTSISASTLATTLGMAPAPCSVVRMKVGFFTSTCPLPAGGLAFGSTATSFMSSRSLESWAASKLPLKISLAIATENSPVMRTLLLDSPS